MEHQTISYQYLIEIKAITMNVKFPCRMKIQYNNIPITSQISSNQSKIFIFNQQITLNQTSQKPAIQLTASLVTQKGGKYIAGLLKLYHNEISKAQGQNIAVPLIKCLDNQAICQLRVNDVKISKRRNNYERVRTNTQNVAREDYTQASPPRFPGKNIVYGQTKSQLNFPTNNLRHKYEWQDNKTKLNVAQSFYQRKINKSPINRKFQTSIQPDRFNAINQRDKLIQAEVYKEGYNKLKQKYKKQAENAKNQLNKRIGLENTQNNLKIEIMRLKLKSQEQQKNLNEKNLKIKQLQMQLSNFQKKQLDLMYLREEYSKKQQDMNMLSESYRNISKQIDQLRLQYAEKSSKDQQKWKEIKYDYDNFKNKAELKEAQLDKQLKSKIQTLRIKQSQLISRTQLIVRQKKAIENLQKDAQVKFLEYERNMQLQRASSKAKYDQIKNKLQKIEREKAQSDQTYLHLTQQLQKQKSLSLKAQYQTKILFQQLQTLKKQLSQAKSFKDKFTQLQRDFKMLNDDKHYLQKQLQRALQNKQINISQLTKQHNQQLQYFKRINKQFDEKNKQLSSKIPELEGQLEGIKINSEKIKRTNQSLILEVNDLKDKQKSLKKSLKNKEQDVLNLQSELTSLKQKNKSGEHFFKHEIDQYKQQLDRIKQNYEDQCVKNVQLSENNSQLNIELGKIKVKLQFLQEKNEKDNHSIIQKKQQIDHMLKDHQIQIVSLTEIINKLRIVQKQLTIKVQKSQMQNLRSQDKLDRHTKEVKSLQERLNLSQHSLKVKQGQNSGLIAIKNQLQVRIRDYQNSLNQTRNENSQLQAQKIKNQKISQIMQQQNSKLKRQIEKSKQATDLKQKEMENIMNEVKKYREQTTARQIKLNSLNNDFNRFKQSVFETLNASFAQVLSDSRKHLSNSQVIDNVGTITRKVFDGSHSSLSQINNLILNHCRDTKLMINKLGEQNKILLRENQKINEQINATITKSQMIQYEQNRHIQELQNQLTDIYNQRDQQNVKMDSIMKDLNNKIKHKNQELTSIHQQMQQLSFMLNNAKMDAQAQLDQNNKKNIQLKRALQQYQQKIQIFTITITNLQQKLFELQTQRQIIAIQLKEEKQNLFKKDKSLMEVQQKLNLYERILDDNKKQRKDLLEKNSSLEVQLNTDKDNIDKLKQLLEGQQHKGSQLKNFINNLMKQKQQAIKNQLQKGQKIIQLQGSLLEVTRDKDLYLEQTEKHRKNNEELKQTVRKLNSQIKQLQNKLAQEKGKFQKSNQKIKEKEKQLIGLRESLQMLQSKSSRNNQKNHRQIKQLREQIQSKTNELVNLSKQYNEKFFNYQKEKQSLQAHCSQLKIQIANLQSQLHIIKENNSGSASTLQALTQQMETLRMKINQLQISNSSLQDQIKDKQQNLFELQGKIYNLQIRIQSKQSEKNEQLLNLDNDWVSKYEAMCEQYQQRIQLVQNQKNYFKVRVLEGDQQIKKIRQQKNNIEIQQAKLKIVLQEKIRKVQQDRLHVVTQKNSQIQKLSEQIKNQHDTAKTKEAQSRRLLHQIQVARSTINKLDGKNRQNQQKTKNLNKVYQAQLEQLKKKQVTYKNFKQEVSSMIWSSERQVRKIIQNQIKKLLQICEDNRTSQRMLDSLKNLQQAVVEAIQINIDGMR